MNEFITLVREMRSAQKQYFKTRLKTDLEESKRLEKLVDMKVKELTQLSLIS